MGVKTVHKTFISLVLLLAGFAITGNAQNATDSGYFAMDQPEAYPPYDSSELRFSKTTLIGGHLIHAFGTRSLYAAQLNETLDLGLGGKLNLVGGFLATTPSIVRALNTTPNPNALWLSHHGTNLGFYYGYAGSAAVVGPNFAVGQNGPLTISVLSSIGFGALGHHLGKQPAWDDNRVSLYKHYGTMGAATGLFLPVVVAPESVPDRLPFIGSLAGAAGGYWYAHHRSQKIDKTRGDYVATDAFTLYNAYYWSRIGMVATTTNPHVYDIRFIPVSLTATIGSSILSQHWLRNARLSRGQSKLLGGILAGTSAAHAFAFDRNQLDDRKLILSLAGSYLVGGIGYKLALDGMKNNNLAKRGKQPKANLSIVPFSTNPLDRNRVGQSRMDEETGFIPSLQLGVKF